MKTTKVALTKQNRQYLDTLCPCASMKTAHPAVFEWYMQLLPRHPQWKEKEGVGIKDLEVHRNPQLKWPVLIIHRQDGSQTDVSVAMAISGKPRPHRRELIEAMRSAIQSQIREFRKATAGQRRVCPRGCQSANGGWHVDHTERPFVQLVDTFLGQAPPAPQIFAEDPVCYNTVFRTEDHLWAAQWSDFHARHARLQWMCAKCNMRKGAKSA